MGETIFTWMLNDFDVYPYSPGERLSSPVFNLDTSKTVKFSLHLYPNGFKEGEDDEFVSLFLKRQKDEGRNEVKIQYEFCLIDSMGECNTVHKCKRSFFKNTSWGCHRFYERSVLLRTLSHRFFRENSLIIHCRILDLDYIEADATFEDRDENSVAKAHSELAGDLNKLLEREVLSDMTILADGGKFNVHRTILECRCPKLLQGLVQLRDSNAYSLPGIRASLLKAMLTYVYTGVYQDRSVLGKVMIAAANNEELSEFKPLHSHKSADVLAVSEINNFQVKGIWEINPLTVMNSSSLDFPVNTEYSLLLLCSEEMPDWSRMVISLTVTKLDTDEFRDITLKFQRLSRKEDIFINCQITIASSEPSDLHDSKHYEHIFKKEDSWVAPLDVDDLSKIKLMNGDLQLYIKVRISVNGPHTEIKQTLLNTLFKDKKKSIFWELSNFVQDFETLYKSMKNADVILCIGDVKMPAHKIILCSKSEVFLRMLSHNTLEKNSHVVHIDGIDTDTTACLLRFMYCGDVDGPMCASRALRLLAAAERYQVVGLKDKCRLYLHTVLTIQSKGSVKYNINEIDNAIYTDCAMFADSLLENSFLQFYCKFIEENALMKFIRLRKDFDDLQNGLDVFPEIIHFFLRYKKII